MHSVMIILTRRASSPIFTSDRPSSRPVGWLLIPSATNSSAYLPSAKIALDYSKGRPQQSETRLPQSPKLHSQKPASELDQGETLLGGKSVDGEMGEPHNEETIFPRSRNKEIESPISRNQENQRERRGEADE
ncbi:hypothetical protein N7467_006477 [Penicillium canescens]|nr:hypothetical protein N7467_006477 [Penicillium canescens]